MRVVKSPRTSSRHVGSNHDATCDGECRCVGSYHNGHPVVTRVCGWWSHRGQAAGTWDQTTPPYGRVMPQQASGGGAIVGGERSMQVGGILMSPFVTTHSGVKHERTQPSRAKTVCSLLPAMFRGIATIGPSCVQNTEQASIDHSI